jgi:hypothetical protein
MAAIYKAISEALNIAPDIRYNPVYNSQIPCNNEYLLIISRFLTIILIPILPLTAAQIVEEINGFRRKWPPYFTADK